MDKTLQIANGYITKETDLNKATRIMEAINTIGGKDTVLLDYLSNQKKEVAYGKSER